MKRIYFVPGVLATFLLASLTGLAQSRSDIRAEIEAKRTELVIAWKMLKKYETPKVNPSEPKVVG